uniref:Membrane-associated guanylate kinase, WW and PDZ domain-containing protein 3-like isoform X2 n=1 Tax=Geotrypetes seraphini TaxID=260995 RepID=A0A6P8NPF3_GEOSA|nr:membrane-associated guanylate kinase, WW and PDZ domain-containing protein 3-like isoform X2 [Geotrypetes seraphini]
MPSARPNFQRESLSLLRKELGCMDHQSMMDHARASHQNWEVNKQECCSLSAQRGRLLQFLQNSAGLSTPDLRTAMKGDVMVVVHGNCIVDYCRGEGLRLLPAVEAVSHQECPQSPSVLQSEDLGKASKEPGQSQELMKISEGLEKVSKEPAQTERSEKGNEVPTHTQQRLVPSEFNPSINILQTSLLELTPIFNIEPHADSGSGSQKQGEEGDHPVTQQQIGTMALEESATTALPQRDCENYIPSRPTALATRSRLTPVPMLRSATGLGFSITMPEQGRGGARVGRIWESCSCPLLAEGDIIMKINGVDICSLSPEQIEEILCYHVKDGDVILLVEREVPAVPGLHRNAEVKQKSPPALNSPLQIHTQALVSQFPSFYSSSNHQTAGDDGPPSSSGLRGISSMSPGFLTAVPRQNTARMEEPRQTCPKNSLHLLPVLPSGALADTSQTWTPLIDAFRATSFVEPQPQNMIFGAQERDPSLHQGHRSSTLSSETDISNCCQRSQAGSGPSAPSVALDIDEVTGNGPSTLPLTEVLLERKENEGFGFVIITEDLYDQRAGSLIPHRISEIRHGSSAQRTHKLQVGDRLEGVNGRSIVDMSHGEIAQLFRQAGTKIRLRILPQSKDPGATSKTEAAEVDIDSSQIPHSLKVQRPLASKHQVMRTQQESRQYSVELQRGATGFGFSLRGGSEYKMKIYILGLMEGGPAERNQKMQVSDQLIEINGRSTRGMTHSEAVELIRRSGNTVHLQLKRGNGIVPDYDGEFSHTSSTEVLQEGCKQESDSKVELSNKARGWKTGSPEKEGQSPPLVADDIREQGLGGLGQKHESSPQGIGRSPRRSQKEGDRGREQRKHHRKSISSVRAEDTLQGVLTTEMECHPPIKQIPSDAFTNGKRCSIPAVYLEPWLRPALLPGPWLVPSKERLHETLCSSQVAG